MWGSLECIIYMGKPALLYNYYTNMKTPSTIGFPPSQSTPAPPPPPLSNQAAAALVIGEQAIKMG